MATSIAEGIVHVSSIQECPVEEWKRALKLWANLDVLLIAIDCAMGECRSIWNVQDYRM